MALSLVFFFISIAGIFLSEIFTEYSRIELSHFIVFLSPFFFFQLANIEKKKISIPVKETIVYLLFILFSIISTVYATDKEIAIRSLLIYLSGYLFFVFSFNHQDQLNKYFQIFLTWISIFSCLVFFADYVFHLNLFRTGISLFYNYGHYQIGNLLVLGLISSFPNLIFLVFFAFILFSYSRTAQITLIFISLLEIIRNKFNRRLIIIGGSIILICLIFIFYKTQDQYKTKKQVVSGRNVYFSYALSSINDYPLFGVGPGNFIYITFKKQINQGEFTDQADNIFLQVLSENGIIAGSLFISFIFLIFFQSKKNKNLLLFLALTLMFMSDLSYSFNSFFILWFILGGLILDSKNNIKIKIIFPITLIFVLINTILFSKVLLNQGLWRQSLRLYPFQKNTYRIAIEKNIRKNNKKEVNSLLEKYNHNYDKSITVFDEINYYYFLNNKNIIAELYAKSLLFRPYITIKRLKEIWSYYIETYGIKEGNKKMAEILKKIKKSYSDKDKNSNFYKIINDFCLKTNIGC